MEKSGNVRKKKEKSYGKSRGILTGCLNLKVLPLLRFNLMVSVSAKMDCQEVREISLRSGKSQGKVRENEGRKSGHPVLTLLSNNIWFCLVDGDIFYSLGVAVIWNHSKILL